MSLITAVMWYVCNRLKASQSKYETLIRQLSTHLLGNVRCLILIKNKTISIWFLVRKAQDKLHSTEEKLQETDSNQADRVDKSLLKNLLIGYIMAPNNDKQQILKLISSVLDFNQQESDRVGLNRSNTGWLTSILHGPITSNDNQPGKYCCSGPSNWINKLNVARNGRTKFKNCSLSTGGSYSKESLAQAFVKFLEFESRPRTDVNAPSLLNMNSPPQNASGDEPVRRTSTIQPVLLPDAMLQTFNTPRNSSSILKDILNDSWYDLF